MRSFLWNLLVFAYAYFIIVWSNVEYFHLNGFDYYFSKFNFISPATWLKASFEGSFRDLWDIYIEQLKKFMTIFVKDTGVFLRLFRDYLDNIFLLNRLGNVSRSLLPMGISVTGRVFYFRNNVK